MLYRLGELAELLKARVIILELSSSSVAKLKKIPKINWKVVW
jgi:hypothetical protein